MKNFLHMIKYIGLMAGLICHNAHSEDLNKIYQLAKENDHNFKAAEARKNADAELKYRQRAEFLPSLSGDVSWLRERDETKTDISNDESTTETTGYTLSLTQPLFNMANWYDYKSSLAQSDSADASFRSARQSLILRTTEAYLAVLLASFNLETSQAEEKTLLEQLNQSKERLDAGRSAVAEVHEVQADYDSAVAARLSNEGRLAIAFEGLDVLTGNSSRSIASLKDDFPVHAPEPNASEKWVERALQNNFSLSAARYSAEAAYQQAKSATSDRIPTVNLNASYSDFSGDRDIDRPQRRNLDVDNETWSVDVTLTIPLFTGGAINADQRRAKQLAIAAQEDYLQVKKEIIRTTRSEHFNVITGVATVKAQKQTIISRQSALEATEIGYEVGSRRLVDVLDAQRELYQAQRDYYSVLFDYILSSLRLKEAAGMLEDNDLTQLNSWLDSTEMATRDM